MEPVTIIAARREKLSTTERVRKEMQEAAERRARLLFGPAQEPTTLNVREFLFIWGHE